MAAGLSMTPVLLGVPTHDIVPAPAARDVGKHAVVGMRTYPDRSTQWVLMIRDQTGQGRHRPCAVCDWAVQASHPGHAPTPRSRD